MKQYVKIWNDAITGEKKLSVPGKRCKMAEFFLAGAPPHFKWCHLSPFVKLPHTLPSPFQACPLYPPSTCSSTYSLYPPSSTFPRDISDQPQPLWPVLIPGSKGSPHFKKVQFFWTLFKRPLTPPPFYLNICPILQGVKNPSASWQAIGRPPKIK